MVALNSNRRNPAALIPSADTDPTELIQHDVSQHVRQQFTIRRTGLILHPRTRRAIREYVIDDQFGNQYITYTFVSSVTLTEFQWPGPAVARVKPSVLLAHGGAINGDLMDKYRAECFAEIARAEAAERREKHAVEACLGITHATN